MNVTEKILKKLNTVSNTYKHRKYTICDLIKTPDSLNLKHDLKLALINDDEYDFFTNIIINITDKIKCKEKDIFIELPGKFYIELDIKNTSIFIYGIYKKMSREMSQTPMTIKRKLKYERSVSDFTESFRTHFGASAVKFAAAGREDADVRCFGRPFILEVVDPTINLYNYSIKVDLYPEVQIDNLLVVKEQAKNFILDGENKAEKIYKAQIYMEIDVDVELKTYNLIQKTPLRVLHRRSNLSRKRSISIISYAKNGKYGEIEFKADAGTYIKEFVSGDFGRTKPNLQTITGCYCELIYLDVIKIEYKKIPDSLIINKITKAL